LVLSKKTGSNRFVCGTFFSGIFFQLFFDDVVLMGRSRNKGPPVQATTPDDEVRARIIRDAMMHAGLPSSRAQDEQHQHNLPEAGPSMKRQKVDKAAPAGYAAQMTRPAQLAAGEAKGEQAAWAPAWPLDDFSAQTSGFQDYALSPIETELLFLREALSVSTKREESAAKMLNACRIQLHKAYRMIALHQLSTFTCDTEMPRFSEDTPLSPPH
jgi:hypothetical protein